MNKAGTTISVGACPHCGKQGIYQYRPFCSKRCADLDLGNWLGERYRIAGTRLADEEAGVLEAGGEDAAISDTQSGDG